MSIGRHLRLVAVLCLLLAVGVGRAAAAPIVLVASERGSAYDEVTAALRTGLRPTLAPPDIEVRNWREVDAASLSGSRVIVTVGAQAARTVAALAPPQPVLHALLPRSAFERLPRRPTGEGRVSAIFLDQPVERQIRLIRNALPGWSTIALLSGEDERATADRLATAARERQLTVHEAQVANERELYPALQNVLAEPAVLLAVPDAGIYNAYTIQNVLLTAYRRQSPVVGFSPAYVRAGALLALYSTPTQIGRQAAAVVAAVLAGAPLPPPQPPSEFEVGVNATVARSLGISLEPAAVLAARLARQENTQ